MKAKKILTKVTRTRILEIVLFPLEKNSLQKVNSYDESLATL